MSEPSNSQLKQIVEIFLEEYNRVNKTQFYWDEERSYVAKSEDNKWVDATVFDKRGNQLDLQHKEVVWDIEYDKIRSSASNKIIKKLIEVLTQRGLVEFSLHLNFFQKRIPTSDKEIDEFCYWISELVQIKAGSGYPKDYHLFLIPNTPIGIMLKISSTLRVLMSGIKNAFYLAFDQPLKVRQHIYSYANDDDIYLKRVKDVTSYIVIYRNPGQKKPIIGWGYSERIPRPLPHFSDVVMQEIKRKVIDKYDNLIILLDCNRPIDEYDQNQILTEIKQLSYSGQIWLIENFASHRRAACIIGK